MQKYYSYMDRATQIARVRELYRALIQAWGPQHWWPAQTRFEVIVGAFLTQNTAWTNVERAMTNLRRLRLLNLAAMREVPLPELAQAIRSAGYFRQKAQRLKHFISFLDARYGGSLDRMFARPTSDLRAELLELNGIGPETADSILLYAGNHPVFVVDAYTRRLLHRHEILPETAKYDDVRELFEVALGNGFRNPEPLIPYSAATASHPPSRMSTAARIEVVQHYNDMHGLIVVAGKKHCFKSRPDCQSCPLAPLLPKQSII